MFEKILGVVSVIAIIMKLGSIPGAGLLLIISWTLLSFFYYLFSFAFLNNIKLSNIFVPKSYQGLSALRIIGSIGTGWVLSTICTGIFFKTMHYSGGMILLFVGVILIFVVAITSLIKFFLSKSDFYKTILLRAAIFGGFGLLFFFTFN